MQGVLTACVAVGQLVVFRHDNDILKEYMRIEL